MGPSARESPDQAIAELVFFGWNVDRVEAILWQLENGELDGVNPKAIVVLVP